MGPLRDAAYEASFEPALTRQRRAAHDTHCLVRVPLRQQMSACPSAAYSSKPRTGLH